MTALGVGPCAAIPWRHAAFSTSIHLSRRPQARPDVRRPSSFRWFSGEADPDALVEAIRVPGDYLQMRLDARQPAGIVSRPAALAADRRPEDGS